MFRTVLRACLVAFYSVAGGAEQIIAHDAEGKATEVARGFRGNDIVVRHDGGMYVTYSGWNGRIANLCFGGEDFDTIFAACGDRVYKRKVKVRGALPFQETIRQKAPRL